MPKEKLWTKDFISVSLVNFVLMLSVYLLLVTMATYAMEIYQASVSTAGLAASIFIIGALIGRLYAGRQIAKVGNKKMLITGSVIFIFFSLFYFIPMPIYMLLVVRVLHGIGVGLATTATGTIVAQVIPSSRSGEGISYFSLSVVLSTAIGPLIAVFLLQVAGYTSLFIFSLVMGIVGLLMGLVVKAPEVETPEETAGGRFKLSNFFELNALPVAIAMFVAAFAYSGILSFINAYTIEIGLTEAGSFYFLIFAVVTLLTRPVSGPLMDRKGGNSVAYPALILFAAGMLLLSQASSGFVLLTAAAIIGLGYGNFQSCAQALAVKVTPHHRMGLANSTYFIFLDLGLGMGPFILGYLVPSFGYRGLYMALVGVIVAGIFVYQVLYGRKDKEVYAEQRQVAGEKA